MANSVDPDEMAHFWLSHLDLHNLHRFLFCSARQKGLKSGLYMCENMPSGHVQIEKAKIACLSHSFR